MRTIAIIITTTIALFVSACHSGNDNQAGSDAKTDSAAASTQNSGQPGNAANPGTNTPGTNGTAAPGVAPGSGPVQIHPSETDGSILNADDVKEYPFYVKGRLINGKGGTIIMDRLGIGNKIRPVYSQVVSPDETFMFTDTVSMPSLYQFRLPFGQMHFIAYPKDTIELTIRLDDPDHFVVKNSPSTEYLRAMYDTLESANTKKFNIDEAIKKAASNHALMLQLQEQRAEAYRAIDAEKMEKLKKMIQLHDTAFASLMASLYLDPDRYGEFMAQVDKKFAHYPKSEFYKALHEKVLAYMPISIGHIAPEIRLPDTSGRSITLSSFRGKYVLLDFWASWSGASREENVILKRIYNKYKSKGLVIVGISLDQAKKPWLDAVRTDNARWYQLCDLLQFQSQPAQTYHIISLPAIYLLYKQGKIVNKGLRPQELEKSVAKMIGK
jgi:peroxiredoxin